MVSICARWTTNACTAPAAMAAGTLWREKWSPPWARPTTPPASSAPFASKSQFGRAESLGTQMFCLFCHRLGNLFDEFEVVTPALALYFLLRFRARNKRGEISRNERGFSALFPTLSLALKIKFLLWLQTLCSMTNLQNTEKFKEV